VIPLIRVTCGKPVVTRLAFYPKKLLNTAGSGWWWSGMFSV